MIGRTVSDNRSRHVGPAEQLDQRMKLTAVLPTYNEADNLGRMVEALLTLPTGAASLSALVVDDQSPDGTGELADELSAREPGRVHVLHRDRREGLGRAYVDGFSRALELGADLILQMDCDFSHPPDAVPAMLEAIEDSDVVLGSRFVAGSEVAEGWPRRRMLLTWFANKVYVPMWLRLGVHDATGGFRLWRRQTLVGVDPRRRVRSSGYAFQVEMAYLTKKLGFRIREIPIRFADRAAGESKMSLAVQFEAAWRVIHMWWRHRHVRPTDRFVE